MQRWLEVYALANSHAKEVDLMEAWVVTVIGLLLVGGVAVAYLIRRRSPAAPDLSSLSSDHRASLLLSETATKFAAFKRAMERHERWEDMAADAGHARWRLMTLVQEESLSLDTHRQLVSKLPFREGDTVPYTRALIATHPVDAPLLIEELLLRRDLCRRSRNVQRSDHEKCRARRQ